MGSVKKQFQVPIIDFAGWQQASPSEQQAKGKEMIHSIRNGGFFYLKNHGIDQTLIDEAFKQSRDFFALPQEQKDLVRNPGTHELRGYSKVGSVNSSVVGDVKETFDFGGAGRGWRNFWPSSILLPDFQKTMDRFYDEATQASYPILQALALGMEIQDSEELFIKNFTGDVNQVRLLHYPAHPAAVFEAGTKTRHGAHRDSSPLTILFQDEVGGLQVANPLTGKGQDEFVDIPPVPGTAVINIGTPWHSFTNDQITAGLHRVTLPPPTKHIEGKERTTRERFSIPVFVDFHPDATLQTWPQFIDEKHPRKYRPMLAKEFVARMVEGQRDKKKLVGANGTYFDTEKERERG